ncbi:uncharacterized protein LOC111316376 [Durio zibethinus]|uniref:Uncharacterized protein LOC111316376 n=1 Tax=Durio zibethinus TaxID=66656 RepID=A0A6P6BAF8_DURZI|nr:uncharacterized protein LOC111316376 [Durio zibethinus]
MSPRSAIKIDLKEAFDSLSWEFLISVLEAMGFPRRFVGWIKGCLTSPMFSLSVNGGLVGYFKGTKGVRQRDPMSPYVFVIAMNVLDTLLDSAASYGIFSYHPKCKKVNLTHLCFADDLLIHTKEKLDSVKGIQVILKQFYTYSGLQLNSAKNELYYTGIPGTELEEILKVHKMGKLPVRYLGVPLVARRLTMTDCMPLIERITARNHSLATRHLSYASRLQLIQSVLFSIHNYWCKHFVLPKKVIKRVNQLCSAFFWKGQSSTAKEARVRWQAKCKPTSEGRLGLIDVGARKSLHD